MLGCASGAVSALRSQPALFAPALQPLLTFPRRWRHSPLQGLRCLASTSRKQRKAAEMAPNIGVILGTMTFGWSYSSSSIDNSRAGEMLDLYLGAGYNHVDTALTYAGGKTERMLGEVMAPGTERALKCGVLATKAGPWQGTATMTGNGGLSPVQLREKVEASLASLKRERIDLLYLHAPDSATPIEDTLGEVHRLHTEGKVSALGLSNYQAWEVCHIWHICKTKGYIMPSVYQGMYNAVTRQVEQELLPCLRQLGIKFYVYNPLAGGLLTGKHKSDSQPQVGRFKGNKLYSDRFWKQSFFEAAEVLTASCEEHALTPVDAALRWLKCHSFLQDGDAVIIGASSISQLQANLAALRSEAPLPQPVVAALDAAWAKCQPDCPCYHRGHSAKGV